MWSRTTFAFHRPHSRSTKWADAVFDKRRRRFHLSDATGTAEVELQGGVAFIPTQAELEFDLTRGGKLPPPLDEILQTSPGLPQGAVWRVRIREERIEPGMELSVSGRIAHVPGESADRVFRDGPSQRARIVGHPDEELVAFSDAGFFEHEVAKERWGMWFAVSMTIGSAIAGVSLVAYACFC
ncbi:MAG: hypothetical protein U0414_03215 [Polyangiaceae bacterium]